VRISITVPGQPPGAVQLSHIDKGGCGSSGGIIRTLHNVVNGISVTMVAGITVEQLVRTRSHITVEGAPAGAPPLACIDI
jgi:hypothetical protein